MAYKTALLAVFALLLSVASKGADTIKWDKAEANITEEGILTVEITAKVHLESGPQGRVCLYLQDKNRALGDSSDADVTVAAGDETVTLKRTITVPKDLKTVHVFTPMYVNFGGTTTIVDQGTLTITWSATEKPQVKVNMPKRLPPAPPPVRSNF